MIEIASSALIGVGGTSEAVSIVVGKGHGGAPTDIYLHLERSSVPLLLFNWAVLSLSWLHMKGFDCDTCFCHAGLGIQDLST